MLKIPLLLCFIYFSAILKGQSSSLKYEFNNCISFTALGPGIFGSINYGGIIKDGSNHLFKGEFSVSYPLGNLSAAYSVYDYIGKRNHHIVFGVGYYLTKFHQDNYFKSNTYAKSYPVFSVGYNYWNPQNRLSYTILLHPMMFTNKNSNIPIWGGLTIGYNFKNRYTLFDPEKKYSYSLSTGLETSIGYGKMKLSNVGTSSVISVANDYFLKFQYAFIYVKGFFGFNYLNQRTVEGFSTRFILYKNNPSFIKAGFEVGANICARGSYSINLGLQVGNYYSNKKLMLKPELPENIIVNESEFYKTSYNDGVSLNYLPGFYGIVVGFSKDITERMQIGLQLKYIRSIYQMAHEYIYVTGNEYYAVSVNDISLGFKIEYRLF